MASGRFGRNAPTHTRDAVLPKINPYGNCRRIHARWKSGGGPPPSKPLARRPRTTDPREASGRAPTLWRFLGPAKTDLSPGRAELHFNQS